MHSTPNSTTDGGTSSGSAGTGTSNVRSWAGHRQAFPLGQAHTPLTSMPTLGRALTDGSLSEVDYVNTFLQRLAQHSGPADDDSETEDDNKFEEEEDDDLYAPLRDEEEEDDYYARRKRRTRWRPNYPKIKKTKRSSIDAPPYATAARTRRASMCVPTANGGGSGVAMGSIKKRRSNSVSSYFAMRSAESSPSTPVLPTATMGSPPMDSPVDDRLSPSRHQGGYASGYPAYASSAYRQTAYAEMERLPEWMMASCSARPCGGDVLSVPHAMPPHPMVAMMMQHPTAFVSEEMPDYPHPHPHPHRHPVPQGLHQPSLHVHPHQQLIANPGGATYAPSRSSGQGDVPPQEAIVLGEDEILASSSASSPSVRVHQPYPTLQQMPLFKQQHEEDEIEMHPGILEPSPEEGEWLDDLLRLEHSSSSSQGDDPSSSSSSSVQHAEARNSSAKDPIYAELFGY